MILSRRKLVFLFPFLWNLIGFGKAIKLDANLPFQEIGDERDMHQSLSMMIGDTTQGLRGRSKKAYNLLTKTTDKEKLWRKEPPIASSNHGGDLIIKENVLGDKRNHPNNLQTLPQNTKKHFNTLRNSVFFMKADHLRTASSKVKMRKERFNDYIDSSPGRNTQKISLFSNSYAKKHRLKDVKAKNYIHSNRLAASSGSGTYLGVPVSESDYLLNKNSKCYMSNFRDLSGPAACQIACTVTEWCNSFMMHMSYKHTCFFCSKSRTDLDLEDVNWGSDTLYFGSPLNVTKRSDVLDTLFHTATSMLNGNRNNLTDTDIDQIYDYVAVLVPLLREHKHTKAGQMVDSLIDFFPSINPTKDAPVYDFVDQALLEMESKILLDVPPANVTAHRTAGSAYGSIPSSASRIKSVITIDTSRDRWHPTGLYAVPGELVSIQVPQNLVGRGYRIRINPHIDHLPGRNTYGWSRLPIVHRYFEIQDANIQVASAFGGAIFIDLGNSPPNLGTVDVNVENAIEHPFFILDKHTDEEWKTSLKNKPAPWAILKSKDYMMSVRATDVSSLTNPTELLKFWQAIVEKQDETSGYDTLRTSGEFLDRDHGLPGGGHSGYPYIVWESKYWPPPVDLKRLTTRGSWGDYHELAHNRQRRWWTLNGDTEVTNNIFTVECMRVFSPEGGRGEADWQSPRDVMRKAVASVKLGPYAALGTGQDAFKKLSFWIQLADGFGFKMLETAFRSYERDNTNNPSALPNTEQERRDQILIRFSKAAGYDLTKFMAGTWGLEISNIAVNEVHGLGLPPWMPAMGGTTNFTTTNDTATTFDLQTQALTMDEVAKVDIVTQGKRGSINENKDGTFTYTPDKNFTGTDSFKYNVTSSSGHSHTTTAHVLVELFKASRTYLGVPISDSDYQLNKNSNCREFHIDNLSGPAACQLACTITESCNSFMMHVYHKTSCFFCSKSPKDLNLQDVDWGSHSLYFGARSVLKRSQVLETLLRTTNGMLSGDLGVLTNSDVDQISEFVSKFVPLLHEKNHPKTEEAVRSLLRSFNRIRSIRSTSNNTSKSEALLQLEPKLHEFVDVKAERFMI